MNALSPPCALDVNGRNSRSDNMILKPFNLLFLVFALQPGSVLFAKIMLFFIFFMLGQQNEVVGDAIIITEKRRFYVLATVKNKAYAMDLSAGWDKMYQIIKKR